MTADSSTKPPVPVPSRNTMLCTKVSAWRNTNAPPMTCVGHYAVEQLREQKVLWLAVVTQKIVLRTASSLEKTRDGRKRCIYFDGNAVSTHKDDAPRRKSLLNPKLAMRMACKPPSHWSDLRAEGQGRRQSFPRVRRRQGLQEDMVSGAHINYGPFASLDNRRAGCKTATAVSRNGEMWVTQKVVSHARTLLKPHQADCFFETASASCSGSAALYTEKSCTCIVAPLTLVADYSSC